MLFFLLVRLCRPQGGRAPELTGFDMGRESADGQEYDGEPECCLYVLALSSSSHPARSRETRMPEPEKATSWRIIASLAWEQ
jgi:hypothetical protein